MSNKTPHKEIPAVTVPIHELMETVEQIYDDWHELRFNCHGNAFIEDSKQEIVESFDSHEQLYLWHFKMLDVLDERRKEALKRQGYIED